ncbi:hypothetical protein, partial [Paenibacillus dendritiformis]
SWPLPASRSRGTGASGRTTRSASCSFTAQLAAAGEPIARNRRFRKNNQERELQLRRAAGAAGEPITLFSLNKKNSKRQQEVISYCSI